MIKIQGTAEAAAKIHYEVDPSLPPIGVGGSGTVRRGVQVNEVTHTTRTVAIKFLFDDLNESAIERSKREASIHIVHENLVEMLGFIETGDEDVYGKSRHYHVVSELLEGVMLLDLLNGKTIDNNNEDSSAAHAFLDLYQQDKVKFAVQIISSVLSGVLVLHDNGYIHRDIDPSNIMITNEGKVKLIDLGIAKQLSSLSGQEGFTQMGQFIGKAAFAAPEQARGLLGSQNKTTDIYSIGIMLYQLIIGKLPFTGNTDEILYQQCNSKIPLKLIKDKKLKKVIKKATEKRQLDRYQSAAEFRVALEQISSSKSSSKTHPNTILYILCAIVGLSIGILLALLF